MKAHNIGFMRKDWGPKPKTTKILTEATDEKQERLKFMRMVFSAVRKEMYNDAINTTRDERPSKFGTVTATGTDMATFTINLAKESEDTARSFDLFKYYRANDVDGAIEGTLKAASDIANDIGFVKHSRDL